VELHLSGLIGTTSHPDMQKIRIIGFSFENRLQWHFELEKINKYNRTPFIRINWDDKPTGYAENQDNWIFLGKEATSGDL
jgi:hypothetical protein